MAGSGTRGRAEHQRAVRALFAERGNIVHRGDVGGLDLRPAQRAYAEVFSRLGRVRRLTVFRSCKTIAV